MINFNLVVNKHNEIIANYETAHEAEMVANDLNAFAKRHGITEYHYRAITKSQLTDEMLVDYMLRKYVAMTR